MGKWDPAFPYVHTHVGYMKSISIPKEQRQACSCDFVCFLHINYACSLFPLPAPITPQPTSLPSQLPFRPQLCILFIFYFLSSNQRIVCRATSMEVGIG